MYYINVPEANNIDCILDGMKELAAPATSITLGSMATSKFAFSIESDGSFKITADSVGVHDADFEVGDTIIVRGSIDSTGLINNDGLYTVVSYIKGEAGVEESVVVAEPVKTALAVADAFVDEYATFILHPTKRTGQICTFIESAAGLATFEVSFRPGGYWASKLEPGLPIMQGNGTDSKMYIVQVETAPYLQTEEEDLDINGVAANDIQKKGTLLMRVFAPEGDPLLAGEVEVAFVQLA